MTTATAPELTGMASVLLAEIHESSLNRRRHFDPKKLQELADSIRTDGVLSPVLVRPHPNGKGGYELAAGHRRRRAALQAGLEEIPAIVRSMTDEQFLKTLVTENLQREDLHPLDEAEGYRDLLQLPGYDVTAVAAAVAKSESYVYQRLKLLELVPSAQKAFLADKLTAGHAILMARLQPKDQELALKAIAEGSNYGNEPMSVREFQYWIRDELLLDLAGAAFSKSDAELLPKAGACTACPKRTGYTPDLFADLEPGKKQRDRCLDRSCFQEKVQLFVDRQRAKLETETGEKPLQLSTNWQSKSKDVLDDNHWREVKKSDPQAKPAVVVEGHGVGQIKYVSTEIGPANPTYYGQSKADVARRKREKLEQDAKSAGRRKLWDAVVEMLEADDAFAKGIPTALFEGLIAQVISRLWNDHARVLCRLLGLEIKKRSGTYGGGPDPDGTLREYAKGLTTAGQGRFLVQLCLVSHLDRTNGYYTGDAKDQLALVARHYNLNPETLVKQGSTALKASREKKKPAAKAKPKKRAGDARRAAKRKAKAKR